jgi:O-acetyl-ADP-ribose deacetylase (regulator of RNase III)
MVEIVQGDLFDADVAALVNPVHCAGLMKRGLCRQFKARFPDNFDRYKAACDADALTPGDVLVHDRGGLFGETLRPRYILNVATKDDWRESSSAEHIESGMESIVGEVERRALSSIAVPALGCGGGGLDWSTVRPLLVAPLDALDNTRALVYAPPSSAPD